MSKWKRILGILVAFNFISLLAGSWIYYIYLFPQELWLCLGMTLQNCMEAMLCNPILAIQDIVADTEFMSLLSGAGTFVLAAYTFAMVMAPLVDLLIALSVLDSFLHIFVGIAWQKKRILIVGYNDEVKTLLDKKSKDGKIYLWTEELLSDEEERDLFLKRISVKMNDFALGDDPEHYEEQLNKLNAFLRRKKITDVLLLEETDSQNMRYYMALSSCEVCKDRTIHFFVACRDFEMRNLLQDYFDGKLKVRKEELKKLGRQGEDTHMDLRIFHLGQILAEKLFEELPLHENRKDAEKKIHLLIYGGEKISESILLHAMNQGVLTSDNEILIDVIGADLDPLKRSLRNRFDPQYVKFAGTEEDCVFEIPTDESDGLLRIRLTEEGAYSDTFIDTVRRLQEEDHGGRYTYLVLVACEAEENIHSIRQIQKADILAADSVPAAVRMNYSKEMKEWLKEQFSFCQNVYLMGENEKYIGIDEIINTDEEFRIRQHNMTYQTVTGSLVYNEKGSQDKADTDRNWNKQEYYRRQSSRALYYHQMVKNELFPDCEKEMQRFWEKTISGNGNDRDTVWSAYLIEKDEKGEYLFPKLLEMAKTEHRRFVYFYASEGWGYDVKKSPEERMHDCLCNWDTLVEKKLYTLIYDLISSPLLMDGLIL